MASSYASSVVEIQKRNRLPCIVGAALAILGILAFSMAGMPFAAPLALLPAAVLVGKRIRAVHRALSSQPCECCNKPAGRYRPESGRISLVCTSCGHVTPTDCGITHAGASIHQIQK